MDLSAYNRIAVIGCPGSGKSTLSRSIAERTGHPLIHLDYERWSHGWIAMPKDEFVALQREWVKADCWLIDGNYGGTMEIRFAAADLVIFLDLPRTVCMWRALKRLGKERPDMKPGMGNPSPKETIAFWVFILRFRRKKRPGVLALQEKYPNVKFVQLRTRKQVKAFLENSIN